MLLRIFAVCRCLAIAAFAALVIFTPTTGAAPLDRVLIVVNDEAITESGYNARYRQHLLELEGTGGLPPETALKQQLTEKIIIDRILVQEARRQGIRVGDEEVERAIAALAERNNISAAQLLAALDREGIGAEDFRAGIRERLVTQRLIDARITGVIQVSDEEIELFLKSAPNLEPGDLSYEFSRIYLALADEATVEEREALRQRAQQVLDEIREGSSSFSAAARFYSAGQQAAEGGYQGWRSADQLPDLYLEALRNLASGEVSDVLESANGFHILRLENSRGSSGRAVEQVHVRHILLRPSKTLPEDEVLNRLRQLRERIEVNGEDFADLAALYSEDLRSRVEGGDLGWISPGDDVPEFEEALVGLGENEVSAPVKTRYGYHLIQLLGRRQRDAAEDLARNRARQAIHSRKAEELYQAWLTELRDRSFVEFVDTP